MNPIAFVLASKEFFVVGPRSGQEPDPAAAEEPGLVRELRRLGWPAEAKLLGPGTESLGERVPGVLVELIDALPILAAPTEEESEGHELAALRQVARLALDLVSAGAALPRLRARVSGRFGWEARWRAILTGATQRAKVVRLGELLVPLTAVPVGVTWGGSALTGQRLVYRMLDACVDVLVREASRRGAVVRLGHWPAGAWEQQLVRALGEDRASFRWTGPAQPAEATSAIEVVDIETIGNEVNAWVQDQLTAGTLSLLPSPAMWHAPETLAQVLRRLLAPAAQLAQTLRSGRPAPRMLPLTTWLPSKAAPNFP